MKLSIGYFKRFKRHWLIKRVDGEYSQHAHLYTLKDALEIKKCIEAMRYPKNKRYLESVKRLLTEEEFRMLNKTPNYSRGRCMYDKRR